MITAHVGCGKFTLKAQDLSNFYKAYDFYKEILCLVFILSLDLIEFILL